MEWHDPPAFYAIIAGINAFWFGVVKYFADRQVRAFDAKLLEMETAIDQKFDSMIKIDKRLVEVETVQQTKPQCKNCGENQSYYRALHARIDAVSSKVDKVDGSLDGLKRAVDLMNEFLIQQGAR